MNNVLSFKDGDKSGDLLYFTGYFILRVQMTWQKLFGVELRQDKHQETDKECIASCPRPKTQHTLFNLFSKHSRGSH